MEIATVMVKHGGIRPLLRMGGGQGAQSEIQSNFHHEFRSYGFDNYRTLFGKFGRSAK